HGEIPDDIPEVILHTNGAGLPVAQAAKQANIVASTSEALRLIDQRGLKINGDVVTDKHKIIPAGETSLVIQAGKRRFARVTVK
ncbi:MAG: tyrosine--tRNA ligase, partial [Burkholderiales bacterium]|nr:tyrosine--tRNA ligase [Burkholderiales bacterium]